MLEDPFSKRVASGALLAKQFDYIARESVRSKFRLVVPEAFVRGIRDLGYRNNCDAIAELIDNSIQAMADRVDVVFGYDGTTSDKKPLQLAVVDNGHGMLPMMIRMAVMWGGTHRENDRSSLGRYGYGLPCSSVSLGRCFTVLSKVEGGPLHGVHLDLDELTSGQYTDASGEIIVPEAQIASLPTFLADHIIQAYPDGWSSGTIVIIEKLDRLEWATTHGLRDNIKRDLGIVYHKLRSSTAMYVGGDYIQPMDPLFLTPEFNLHDLDDDQAQGLDPVRVEVRHPETGIYMGSVVLRYAWFPPSFGSIDKDRDATGLNANARFPIIKRYHGILFSRNGRLIDVRSRTPWTSFVNNDRYIKVEVEFSADLDELFGVTTSKQHVTVSGRIWDLLREAGLPKAIEQLRNKVKEIKAGRRISSLPPMSGHWRSRGRVVRGNAALEDGPTDHLNPGTGLRVLSYRVELEHGLDQPFFRIGGRTGSRTLCLNTAHPFYDGIYRAPEATPATRIALDILLLTMGEAMLDVTRNAGVPIQLQIAAWSRCLELALANPTAQG